jgi:hypothetical protein
LVFCDLLRIEESVIIYKIGGTSRDLTGELVIRPSDNCSFELRKEPENSEVALRHIEYMISRHRQEFREGNYPERMAYQIG